MSLVTLSFDPCPLPSHISHVTRKWVAWGFLRSSSFPAPLIVPFLLNCRLGPGFQIPLVLHSFQRHILNQKPEQFLLLCFLLDSGGKSTSFLLSTLAPWPIYFKDQGYPPGLPRATQPDPPSNFMEHILVSKLLSWLSASPLDLGYLFNYTIAPWFIQSVPSNPPVLILEL